MMKHRRAPMADTHKSWPLSHVEIVDAPDDEPIPYELTDAAHEALSSGGAALSHYPDDRDRVTFERHAWWADHPDAGTSPSGVPVERWEGYDCTHRAAVLMRIAVYFACNALGVDWASVPPLRHDEPWTALDRGGDA